MQFNSKEQIMTELVKMGHENVKIGTGNKLTVIIGKGDDRVGTLVKISESLGGKYNATGSGSSIGRTELGRFLVFVKDSGGGSGAGADVTKLTESAQCLYCATGWANDTYTRENLKKNSPKAITDERLDNMLTKLSEDWIASCMLVAEKLKKELPNKQFTFHRGSPFVDKLESHWKKLNTRDKKFTNLNKWSPADIYIITDKGNKAPIEKTKSILELNSLLLENYKSGDIIPVSLKKTKDKVNFVEKNIDKTRKTYNFQKYNLGMRDFFQSNDGYIFYDGGKIQFRTFGSTWQGEIKGKFANMGKISGGPIATILKDDFGIKLVAQNEIQRSRNNAKYMKMFHDFYIHTTKKKITYDDFVAEVMKKDNVFWISKFMTAQLMYHIEQMKTEDRNKFVSSVLNYAGSESALSAPYAKVY